MSSERSSRLVVTKTVLWFLLGAGAVSAAARFAFGLGRSTALTDLTPWGLWIGFDVVSGVALAAGGFVIAAVVHVFHRERFEPILRPAILTAFLGYTAVVLGLLADLGRPWNIWRMTIYWQPHSPLFEVGWCVMLYLSVLTLEFAPVVFEGLKWNRAFQFLRRFTLPLVIAGIALSTLHQSSLGSLFLIAPGRLHTLWWSPILPLLFFVSAVGLGLGMVTVESVSTSWLYRRKAEWSLLPSLTRGASIVLLAYLALRLGDLAVRGQLRYAFEGSWSAALFWTELTVSVVAPVLLFTLPSLRPSRAAQFAGAFMVVGGFVLNRATVAGISHMARTGQGYVPALTELFVSLGIVATMALVFLFFVERLGVWEEPPEVADHFRPTIVDPATRVYVRGPWLGGFQRATQGLLAGALVAFVAAQNRIDSGVEPDPVGPPRPVSIERYPRPAGPGHVLLLASASPIPDPAATPALLIDGDRGGRFTLFDHDEHRRRLGGNASCDRCHHRNAPLERGTSCSHCHRDMYSATDTFSHEEHVVALAGNASCARCHPDGAAKTRAASAPCTDCHEPPHSTAAGAAWQSSLPPGVAPSYRDAMHGLCVTCHAREEAKKAVETPYLSRCPACHRGVSDRGWDLKVREGWRALGS